MAEKITVYVRKGRTDHERILSFNRPPDIPQTDILEAGMAFDGNAVVSAVEWNDRAGHFIHALHVGDEPCREHHQSLAGALRCAEAQLFTWLVLHDYEVEFA